jgi:hypothetical protein
MAGGRAGDGDGSSGDKHGSVMAQWIIHEVGGGTAFPVLTKTNYTDWAMLMRIKLKACGLWVTVDKGGADPQEDMMALDALVSVVPLEMVATMADKKTVKEAWDAIATLRVGDDRVQKAVAQQLRIQFDYTTFGEGESVEDFALRLNSMVATMATHGKIKEEYIIIEKILRCLPQRLKQIAHSISTLLDVWSLTIANQAGRLRAAEEAFEEPPPMLLQDGKLYLTEEEWNACRTRRDEEKRDQVDPGEHAATVVAMEVAVAMITVVDVGAITGARMEVAGRRKPMNVVGVVN